PVAVLLVVVAYAIFGVLTYQGTRAQWSPKMTAWSGDPVPVKMLRGATPLELQGAAVFQYKNCRNCHALGGTGGERGPDMSYVGARLTRGQLMDQVSNGTPGGGNMPVYGKQITANEMSALVEFLVARRQPGRLPARPADTRP